MNLLILEEEQFTSEEHAFTTARQTQHIAQILKLSPGDSLQVGKINGCMGTARIAEYKEQTCILSDIQLSTPPPPKLPLHLILAMPRPQMIKRILQSIATMGVDHLTLIQTSRVEKSFWQSPSATDRAIREQLILGLEQGRATQIPSVSMHKRFRPFIEDELPQLNPEAKKYIADPGGKHEPKLHDANEAILLAIGPEGGFLQQEVEMFQEQGFDAIHLGERILKVETAVPVLISKLFHFS